MGGCQFGDKPRRVGSSTNRNLDDYPPSTNKNWSTDRSWFVEVSIGVTGSPVVENHIRLVRHEAMQFMAEGNEPLKKGLIPRGFSMCFPGRAFRQWAIRFLRCWEGELWQLEILEIIGASIGDCLLKRICVFKHHLMWRNWCLTPSIQ